ncbi:hypothetical protein DUT88_22445 [Shouchella clausii]|nr:hypothetical protein DA802_04655 [Shouchella clausii]QNM45754.1 hypothetical protein DUT88_22445 [Shouchella clausii]
MGVGLGIQSKEDVAYLKKKSDLAIIGSELLRKYETKGLAGVKTFMNEVTNI